MNPQGGLILPTMGQPGPAMPDDLAKIDNGELVARLVNKNNNPKGVPAHSSLGTPMNRMPRQNKSAPSQNNISSQGG